MYIVQINICDNGSTGKIMRDIMNALPTDRVESKAYVSRKYTDDKRVVCMHTKFRYRVHKFLSMYLGLDELGSYFSIIGPCCSEKITIPFIFSLSSE